jgi:CDP-diacylglycerol--glycerol-3-phosphate 3-phosphatidyltransferase
MDPAFQSTENVAVDGANTSVAEPLAAAAAPLARFPRWVIRAVRRHPHACLLRRRFMSKLRRFGINRGVAVESTRRSAYDESALTPVQSLDADLDWLGEKTRMWNIPNSLTLLRIVMAPLLVVVLLTEFPDKEIWGLVIFLIAALTDALDGMIARRTNRITVTGAMLDPIADKLLMSAAFISLVELGLAPAWMVTIIVGREFAVTGLRLIALERNVPISANAWGKAKTTTQIIAVSLLIFGSHLGPLRALGPIVLWVALILTIISMVIYFRQNWRIIREAEL